MVIKLKEFLYDLEFDYEKIDERTIKLVDLLGANLGNIEEERFEIWEQLPMALVDRLETYIDDYHIDGIISTLRQQCGYKGDISPYIEGLIPAMKQYPTQFNKSLIKYIEDIVNANIDISELKEKTDETNIK